MRGDTDKQIAVFFPGFVQVMAGLLITGPWLTMAGSALMARRTSRPATLIAARRLADNPKADFRAISGLILALFIASVAVAIITTENVNRGAASHNGPTASRIVADQLDYGTSQVSVPGSLLAKLQAVPGVTALAVARVDRGFTANSVAGFPFDGASFMSCAQLHLVPALGHGPAGAAVPLIIVALLSTGAGFGASALYLHAQPPYYGLASPGPGYFGIVLAALALAAIIAATFPLLARITGPETARNE
jgi:hypothetical protein